MNSTNAKFISSYVHASYQAILTAWHLLFYSTYHD